MAAIAAPVAPFASRIAALGAAIRTEAGLARAGLALVALHVLDDSFFQPNPGTSAANHVFGGLVPTVLLVLAIGSGSLFFSHVNDAGFWLVKEYFRVNVVQNLKTWSVMETLISVVGLVFVLIAGLFV